MANEKAKGSRKRLGEWQHLTRTHEVAGVGVVEYKVVVVDYKGKTWERPDTREGRAEVTREIGAVNDRVKRRGQVQALHLRVSEMATAWVGGADESMALAQAADKLRDVVDHMDANDAVM